MTGGSGDLTGNWDDTFAYDDGLFPPTPFLASIVQHGSSVRGRIIEPNLHRPASTAEAMLAGVASGSTIDFTKKYIKPGFGYENPVDYTGQVRNDGSLIEGVWFLLDLSGTFEMVRQDKVVAEEEVSEGAAQPVER